MTSPDHPLDSLDNSLFELDRQRQERYGYGLSPGTDCSLGTVEPSPEPQQSRPTCRHRIVHETRSDNIQRNGLSSLTTISPLLQTSLNMS